MKPCAHNANVLPRRQRGVSLVEIMIAITVGLVLTAGVIQVFVSNKQIYRVQEALARLQENGRFAVDFLTRDVRGAGFLGCAGYTTPIVNTLNNPTSLPWNFASPMQGSDAISMGTWNPPLDVSIVSPLGGRDVITVRRSVGDAIPVIGQAPGAPPGSNDINVAGALCPGPNPLCDFDTPTNPIAMISDCINAAVFQISNPDPSSGIINHFVGGTPGNTTNALGKDFTNTADVVRLSTLTYYIRSGVLGRPSLWRQDGVNPAQELVEGVEDMQVRYGVDTDVDKIPNQYLQANAVTDFNNVVSVRVDLLLQSIEDNLTNAPPRYTYNGVTCPGGVGCPTDRRYRQVFGATIGLRNKIL